MSGGISFPLSLDGERARVRVIRVPKEQLRQGLLMGEGYTLP